MNAQLYEEEWDEILTYLFVFELESANKELAEKINICRNRLQRALGWEDWKLAK